MPNRILPETLRMEPRLCACPRPCRLFFFHLYLVADDYRRAPVGLSPKEPTVLRSLAFPADPDVRISDVSRWLHELELAGAVAIRNSDRGYYVEIAEELWYRREDYGEHQPKWGPKLKPPPAQQSPPLGPVSVKKPQLEHSRSRNRVESESDPESRPKPTPEKRARCANWETDEAKRKAGFFASGPSAFPGDAAWEDFCRDMGEEEMRVSGMKWAGFWHLAAQELGASHRDWRAQPPQDRNPLPLWMEGTWKRLLRRA